MSLSGKTCLIAGASRGIGLAIAQGIARAGAETTLAARSLPALQKAADELNAEGHKAKVLKLDFTDAASIVAAGAGDYDILINVAGTNFRKRFESYTPEEA